jgi:acyl carrier protein
MTVTQTELLDLVSAEAHIERDRLTPEAALADLGFASLDMITLLFELEERYGVVIEEADLPPLQTVGELTGFLLGRINAVAAE